MESYQNQARIMTPYQNHTNFFLPAQKSPHHFFSEFHDDDDDALEVRYMVLTKVKVTNIFLNHKTHSEFSFPTGSAECPPQVRRRPYFPPLHRKLL